MNQQIISELESAARIILAPPDMVTSEQRHAAEAIFLNFRKTKMPYNVCREILETSHTHYMLFEAAEVLKSALIREFSLLQESDIISLRQYLLHYITSRDLPPFVQDRILQVIAIMVKRASVEDFGQERSVIINEVESLIVSADLKKLMLGCKIILNLMQEYSNTVKSTDVGLPWEVHFKVKKQFEATDLKRIFQFSVQLLADVTKSEPPYSAKDICLTEYLLTIAENILTWGYIPPMLPKRIIGVYESAYEADQSPALKLTIGWKNIMFAPQLLPLLFQIYWKIREHDQLAHHALTILVQMATLSGGIMNNDELKLQYLNGYLDNFLKLTSSVIINNKESLGISNIVRRLQLFFCQDLVKLPKRFQESYLHEVTRLTCVFSEGAALEESQSVEDKYFVEAFDNMLEAWTSIIPEFSESSTDLLVSSSTQIFNAYLHCHLAPPDGSRLNSGDDVDEIEDNDRIKFQDQLQTIGMFGRLIPSHALPVLYRLLEDRTNRLRTHLHAMQCQAMTIADSHNLDNLFEDIHWTVLIAGHVLCMDCDGETPLIPSEVMQYSIDQCTKTCSNLNTTLKFMAAVQQVDVELVDVEQCDHAIRIFTDVLKLCKVESQAAEVKLGHFMSPEVGCSLMWFLKRWCLSYLLPMENFYEEFSPTLIGALGKDTEGATFTVNYVVSKIQSNICHYNSEPVLLKDTVELFNDLVSVKQKSTYIVKTSGLWNLLQQQAKLNADMLPQNIRRELYKGFVSAGAGLQEQEITGYYEQILKPVQIRFKTLLSQENLNRIYQEENVKKEMVDILECFIGVAKGTQMGTVQILFDFLSPMLSELVVFVNMYHNYQVIVQLILELFGQCANHMLCYLSQQETKKLYESTLSVVQMYAKCNVNRLSTEVHSEESSFQDLVLVMDLLTLILSKDCLDLSPLIPTEEVTVTAADVSLFGLNFIMPLMTTDLLKYPSLCLQYYRLIMLINDSYPEKIGNLPDNLLRQLLSSVELGLTQFSSDVVQACLVFVQDMATYIHRHSMQNSNLYALLLPFLKLLIDLTLSHQIHSMLISTASTCIYSLICCYSDQYQVLVQTLIQSQTDPAIAERLASAFTNLTQNLMLNCERTPKLKFRDNFNKFIANVHGFLLVK